MMFGEERIHMITLRKITLDNRRSIFNLEVSEEQRQYVASNLEGFGFHENGEVCHDELITVLEL
jgi:hypothetical protein